MELTERQQNELAYHRDHARQNQAYLDKPISWAIVERPFERWWNAHWQMYEYLSRLNLEHKRVLVIGCGFGHDALYLAKMGAEVHAFDLCPESLAIARQLAEREGLSVAFDEMPAEALTYADGLFDCIVARDILHHVDIPEAMREIRRVAKPGAVFVANEIYSHSVTERVRHSSLVDRFVYPLMARFIYGTATPYITEDERKLDEHDMRAITHSMRPMMRKYFNCLVSRVVPERYVGCAKIDRRLLGVMKSAAPVLGGRVLFAGRL